MEHVSFGELSNSMRFSIEQSHKFYVKWRENSLILNKITKQKFPDGRKNVHSNYTMDKEYHTDKTREETSHFTLKIKR